MSRQPFVSFRPGELLPEPVRVPILEQDEGWIAFAKPAGVGATPHFLNGECANLLDALRARLRAGSQQVLKLGLENPSRVHLLEPEVSGAVVFGASEKDGAALREAMGSGAFEFVFDLLVEGARSLDPFTCDLPVAFSRLQNASYVSHRHGKKSATHFRPCRRFGRYSLWEAVTRESRPLQVRLHAHEGGLPIPGERRFSNVSPIYLSMIKRHYRAGKGVERPLHGPMAIHLREIRIAKKGEDPVVIHCPRPKTLAVAISLLEKHLGAESLG